VILQMWDFERFNHIAHIRRHPPHLEPMPNKAVQLMRTNYKAIRLESMAVIIMGVIPGVVSGSSIPL